MDGTTVLIILGLLFLLGKNLIPNPFNTSSNVNTPSTGGMDPSFALLQQGPGPQNIPAISAQNQQAGPVAKPSPWTVACTPSPTLPMNPVAIVATIPTQRGTSLPIPARTGGVTFSQSSGSAPSSGSMVTFG